VKVRSAVRAIHDAAIAIGSRSAASDRGASQDNITDFFLHSVIHRIVTIV
jgi:hypothetical protein